MGDTIYARKYNIILRANATMSYLKVLLFFWKSLVQLLFENFKSIKDVSAITVFKKPKNWMPINFISTSEGCIQWIFNEFKVMISGKYVKLKCQTKSISAISLWDLSKHAYTCNTSYDRFDEFLLVVAKKLQREELQIVISKLDRWANRTRYVTI